MRYLAFLLAVSSLNAQVSPQAFAAKDLQDLPGISRFSGSVLLDGGQVSYAELEFPAPASAKTAFIVAGKLTWRSYLSPEGRSPIEVYRNYETALKQAGFTINLPSTPSSPAWRNYSKPDSFTNRFQELAPGKNLIISYANRPVPITDLVNSNNAAGLYASRTASNGATQHLLLAIASKIPNASVALPDKKTTLRDLGERTYAFLGLVEEKGPELGNVQVFDATAIRGKLTSEGRIAFYALYFDTGKADLKPESKPQLDSMAEVLKANPAFNVYIVGHTDTIGELNMNLDLSRRRG